MISCEANIAEINKELLKNMCLISQLGLLTGLLLGILKTCEMRGELRFPPAPPTGFLVPKSAFHVRTVRPSEAFQTSSACSKTGLKINSDLFAAIELND